MPSGNASQSVTSGTGRCGSPRSRSAILQRLAADIAPAHPQRVDGHQRKRTITPGAASGRDAVEVQAITARQDQLGIEHAAGRERAESGRERRQAGREIMPVAAEDVHVTADAMNLRAPAIELGLVQPAVASGHGVGEDGSGGRDEHAGAVSAGIRGRTRGRCIWKGQTFVASLGSRISPSGRHRGRPAPQTNVQQTYSLPISVRLRLALASG